MVLKKILLLHIIVLILLLSCSVNNKTGYILISNSTTNNTLKNVKIGNTLIAAYVEPGSKVDYWYYSEFSGKLTFEGNFEYYKSTNLKTSRPLEVVSQEDGTFTCKTNCWISVTASAKYNNYNNSDIVSFSATESGETGLFSDESPCISY